MEEKKEILLKSYSYKNKEFGGAKLLVFFLIIIAIIIATFFGIRSSAKANKIAFLEKNPPRLEMVSKFEYGIGTTPVTYKWHLSDDGAGLYEAHVVLYQKDRKFEITNPKLNGVKDYDLEITIDAQKLGLQAGAATLELKVFDKTFYFNGERAEYKLLVDYSAPKLQVISTQHNAVQGGTQLVIYEASDTNLSKTGIEVDNIFFEGFPASYLDSDFATTPKLHACFYSVPLDADFRTTRPKVVAYDIAHNKTTRKFYNKVAPVRYSTLKTQISNAFITKVINPLISNNSERLKKKLDDDSSINNLEENFKLVNEILRKLDRFRISKLLNITPRQQLFSGAFYKPAGMSRSEYGHLLDFIYNNNSLGTLRQLGYQFQSDLPNGELRAINSGTVFYTGELGIYGNFIIIEHGLGLFSIYSQLDKIFVTAGDEIQPQQTIATLGDSGFALNKGVQIEIWLENIPVNPREWWDPRWYNDHVTSKIREAKNSLGINVTHRF